MTPTIEIDEYGIKITKGNIDLLRKYGMSIKKLTLQEREEFEAGISKNDECDLYNKNRFWVLNIYIRDVLKTLCEITVVSSINGKIGTIKINDLDYQTSEPGPRHLDDVVVCDAINGLRLKYLYPFAYLGALRKTDPITDIEEYQKKICHVLGITSAIWVEDPSSINGEFEIISE